MALAIDDVYLPAVLTGHPMTDEEFTEFCAQHPDLNFEMSAEGEIIVMAPNFSLTGIRNSRITKQLEAWAEQDGRGFAFDSSSGFVLPNGARRSPDASWALKGRVKEAAPANGEGFWHLCPDFAIELRSSTDQPKTLRAKMREYLANGAQLAWLIHPKQRSVEIYRPNGEMETLTGIDSIAGEGPVSGFVLDLSRVWDPLAGA